MNENLSLAQAERKHLKGLEIIAHAKHFKAAFIKLYPLITTSFPVWHPVYCYMKV